MLPLEVVGLMITLLSFVIGSPPGPIQLIITELNSTPLTVLTIHWISCGLPTITPCISVDGNMVSVGAGTEKIIRTLLGMVGTLEIDGCLHT